MGLSSTGFSVSTLCFEICFRNFFGWNFVCWNFVFVFLLLWKSFAWPATLSSSSWPHNILGGRSVCEICWSWRSFSETTAVTPAQSKHSFWSNKLHLLPKSTVAFHDEAVVSNVYLITNFVVRSSKLHSPRAANLRCTLLLWYSF